MPAIKPDIPVIGWIWASYQGRFGTVRIDWVRTEDVTWFVGPFLLTDIHQTNVIASVLTMMPAIKLKSQYLAGFLITKQEAVQLPWKDKADIPQNW